MSSRFPAIRNDADYSSDNEHVLPDQKNIMFHLPPMRSSKDAPPKDDAGEVTAGWDSDSDSDAEPPMEEKEARPYYFPYLD